MAPPKRLKSLPGEIYDISRSSGIPINSPSFPTSVINSSSNPQSPFIIVFSENIGIKPIYIAASKGGKKNKGKEDERKGVKEKGHSYHPAPKVDEIKGFGELKPVQGKTPKQGGGGRRNRWVGDKGRKIYEWDSQHGELEGYRGSDGQHIGAFDPKSGKQLKPADPKRNIKKYL